MTTLLWVGLALLASAAGVRTLLRLRAGRAARGVPRVDDRALERILATGRLEDDRDEPLDVEAAQRAEEEFWSESSWDEPEEYGR